MSQIFLSYRRSDSEYASGRISDRLRQRLGNEAVFRDVETVRLGEDFEKRVHNMLENCAVMLVVIGDEWLDVRDKEGKRRLDNPDDLVRGEVVAALSNEGTVVIPVLLGNAVMPTESELPDDLKPLATRNAATVRADASFDDQIEALIKEILRRAPELSPTVRYGKVAGMIGGVLLLALIAFFAVQKFEQADDLFKITWSGENFKVSQLSFKEIGYQAVYLRSEDAASAAISGAEVEKYELNIEVKDENGNIADDLLKVTQVYWHGLPEDHKGRERKTIFLLMEAGDRQGTAHVRIWYVNDGDGKTIEPSVRIVEIKASGELQLLARDEIEDVEKSIKDASVSDDDIRKMANDLLEDENGKTFKNVFTAEQTAKLAKIREDAAAADKQFQLAKNQASDAVSLAKRESDWTKYINMADDLGRPELSSQIIEAKAELKSIEDYRDNTMDSVDAAVCKTVANKNCVGATTCFPASGTVQSWIKLDVAPTRATIEHELVLSSDNSVKDSETANVERSNGWRSYKKLTPPVAGEYEVRVKSGGVVVASTAVCFGSCEACP